VDLQIPRDLSTPGAALTFLDSLNPVRDRDTVILDFGRLSFARPYATLLVADGLRAFVRERLARGMQTHVRRAGIFVGERESAISYLGHVGFFEYVGIQYGNPPGAARGGVRYLPLTVINRAALNAGKDKPIQDAIYDKCQRLADMIFDDESEQDLLAYCLREIVRNVFEHARTDSCTVMAQKYYGSEVEIAIADAGCGIQESLGGDYLKHPSIEALKAAIQPGITRVTGQQNAGKWDNTGFGLYVCSRLAQETGAFALASSGALLTLAGQGASYRQAVVGGTAIRLVVNASEAEYFPNRVAQIVDEGEREAISSGRGVLSASKSTRMSTRR
jgi:anti-sigma regulatory factor (Ser/Thr protein kinase)